MGRGPTAYFLFSDENRASAKAELAEQPGKHGVAQVAKLIGQRWAALSEEEKQVYKDRAAKLQEEAAATAAAEQAEQAQQSPGGSSAEGAAAEEGGEAPAPPAALPISIVKRIVMMDSDVKRLSAEAVRAIAKAAELFAGQLAVKAMEHAAKGKRKNFKASDVEQLASRDRRLIDMGLREILEEHAQAAAEAAAAAADGEAGEQNGSAAKPPKLTKKQKKDEAAAAGTRQITSFFAATN
ncbi:hypothetical protein ABPG75_006536 [Micractinium tetrahymenae]